MVSNNINFASHTGKHRQGLAVQKSIQQYSAKIGNKNLINLNLVFFGGGKKIKNNSLNSACLKYCFTFLFHSKLLMLSGLF